MYLTDSPYSRPEQVGYDAWGRPVYNRNARQKALASGGSIDDLGFGGPIETMTGPAGSGGLLDSMRSAGNVAGAARDLYKMADSGFGTNSAFGPGTRAGGLLNPTEFGAFGEAPLGYSGPAHLSEWAAADALDMGIPALAEGIAGAGPSTLLAAGSTATGPGGMLVGGGATSLAPSTSGGALAGMGPLGYGAAGIGAVLAMAALGGAFDGPTARVGLNSRVPLTSGGLGAAAWNQADDAAYNAPSGHQARVDELYAALNERIKSGTVDPSWLNPDANVFIEYGSDADLGLGNPEGAIIFDPGLRSSPWYGADGMAGGNEPIGTVGWHPLPTGSHGPNYDALLQMIRTAPLPLFQQAGTYQLPADLYPLMYGTDKENWDWLNSRSYADSNRE